MLIVLTITKNMPNAVIAVLYTVYMLLLSSMSELTFVVNLF